MRGGAGVLGWLWVGGLAVLPIPAASSSAASVSTGRVVFVSARTGNDATGDGTEAAPLRSWTRALRTIGAAGAGVTLQVDIGRYDTGSGEQFPLELPAGLRVRGLTAERTVLDGGGAALLVRVASGAAETVLEQVHLVGGSVGMELAPGGAPLRLLDVLFDGLEVGLDLVAERAAAESLPVRRVRAVASRWRDCGTGLLAVGAAPLELDLARCAMRGGRVGLLLSSDDEAGVHHRLRVRDSSFEDCAEAGVLRRGAVGSNRCAEPYLFEHCRFRRNGVGLGLTIPAGDTPLRLRHCRFLENARFGLQVTGGSGGDPEQVSTIEDCLFRWNGVGLHLVNCRLRYRLHRLRVEDNLGNGVFTGSFEAQPMHLRLTDSLLAGDGASGLCGVSDGRQLTLQVADCTIVDNRDAGIHRQDRRGGESRHEVRGCILAGNGRPLRELGEGEVFDCLLEDGTLAGVDGNFAADPGFRDRLGRDWRLATDSPCRGRGRGAGGDPAGPDRPGGPTASCR